MLQIYASNKWESKSKQAAGPVIFGREPEPGGDFCVLQDPFVSRSQLKVEELPGPVRKSQPDESGRLR
jgi:hypothetical protein